jgi:hypothetical protein
LSFFEITPAEMLEAGRAIAVEHIRRGDFTEQDLTLLGLTRQEAELARKERTYRRGGGNASLWSAPVMLTAWNAANLSASPRATGHTRQLYPAITGSISAGGGELFVSLAHVIVASSGRGNVRTDVEADIRRVTGSSRGDLDEVTVSFIPGFRPVPYNDGGSTGPAWMARGLPQ